MHLLIIVDAYAPFKRSQVIGEFCKEFGIGADIKKKLIGIAKDNGGKLGFLA